MSETKIPALYEVRRQWTCHSCGAYVEVSAWQNAPIREAPPSAEFRCPFCGERAES